MTRQALIAGNWKMNGSRQQATALAGGIAKSVDTAEAEVLLCPPFPYLGLVGEELAGTAVALGAQNLSQHDSGAFTGETSAGMLSDCGCRYVIVGHSERRQFYAEDSSLVAEKARVAAAACSNTGANCASMVFSVLPDSRSSKVSPTHTIGRKPPAAATRAFSATSDESSA